jgi:methionyl-tRNA synthetase
MTETPAVPPTPPVPPPPPATPVPPPPPALLKIDEFRKIVLKTGKVLEAADHPNAQKLLVLKVDLGKGDVRQIVAGIKAYYPPAQLVGKNVVVVANLQPAVLRGMESQGMLLAASTGTDVVVLTPDRDVPPGSPVS